jgi:pyridoxal phosphate enzyme (YggS family)
MEIINNFNNIQKIAKLISPKSKIIAVTKNFSLDYIEPLILSGHLEYGENRVQEAVNKWGNLIKINSSITLHFIGKLQTNKATDAVKIFKFIHSLDSIKLAEKLSAAEKTFNKKLKYFIQVNISNEPQKAGINEKDLPSFIKLCKVNLNFDVIGLMCIPAVNVNSKLSFLKLRDLATSNTLEELSMGMSNDYEEALKAGSTYLRIGSAIFGNRN